MAIVMLMIVVPCVLVSSEATLVLVVIVGFAAMAELGVFRYVSVSTKASLLIGVLLVQVVAGLGSMYWIRTQPYGIQILVIIATGVFANDASAWFGGRTLRRLGYVLKPMAPKLSPGKSHAGLRIGLAGGWLAAFLALAVIQRTAPGFPMELGSVIALITPPLAVAGDLIESATKRALHIKDFSSTLGSHGGVLDRIDAVTLAMIGAALVVEFVTVT